MPYACGFIPLYIYCILFFINIVIFSTVFINIVFLFVLFLGRTSFYLRTNKATQNYFGVFNNRQQLQWHEFVSTMSIDIIMQT